MFGVEVNCQNNSNKRKAVLAGVVSTVMRFYLTVIAVTASSSMANIRFVPVLAVQMFSVVGSVESRTCQHSAFSKFRLVLLRIVHSLRYHDWVATFSYRHLWSREQVNSKQTLLCRAAVAIKVQLAFDGCATVEGRRLAVEQCTKPIPKPLRMNRDEVHPSRKRSTIYCR